MIFQSQPSYHLTEVTPQNWVEKIWLNSPLPGALQAEYSSHPWVPGLHAGVCVAFNHQEFVMKQQVDNARRYTQAGFDLEWGQGRWLVPGNQQFQKQGYHKCGD